MEESYRYGSNEPKLRLNPLELNNNRSNARMFDSNESLRSGDGSSVASSPGDFQPSPTLEDYGSDGFQNSDFTKTERSGSFTSLSENSSDTEQVEVFPSVPDQFLEEIGLLGDDVKSHQSNEEMEQKFVTLSLAFSIDAKTIKDRCQRLQRYRDQTEKNLGVEIERLIERVNRLTKLCIDMESTQLLVAILTQIDIVVKASAMASSSAERYGAVQHEERLSEAVQVMMNHVSSLKQQRDLARKQFQYTKKMLQTSNSQPSKQENKTMQLTDDSTAGKRRASFASPSSQDKKKSEKFITRRISELSFGTSATSKLSRPTRMDTGFDLVKIKEKMSDENSFDLSEPISDEKASACDTDEEDPKTQGNISNRHGTSNSLNYVQDKVEILYRKWSEDGRLSNIFYVCSILCFCFAIIIMADILFELEFSKG